MDIQEIKQKPFGINPLIKPFSLISSSTFANSLDTDLGDVDSGPIRPKLKGLGHFAEIILPTNRFADDRFVNCFIANLFADRLYCKFYLVVQKINLDASE
ncbi:Hypothetical protein CINCED_3A001638 [Cinara cedri]|uniref:Uncharacterized protein n=1 Tax=Cinara cedri TaxID=506608 RepID=A0A5E4MFC6_9HEMI|nr:Hypothetical protein CINCED_3A001638 [Cinara cedri]